MTISAIEIDVPGAEGVTVTEDTLSVDLSDGRTISVPLAWFPRLMHSTPEERNNWRLIEAMASIGRILMKILALKAC